MGGPERIGFTGHQGLTSWTEDLVRDAMRHEISSFERVRGISSLAEGSDQIFSELVVDMGGELEVVVPSSDYESTFDETGLRKYRSLSRQAVQVTHLGHDESNEEAFWAAGKHVVDLSDRVLAVWNGEPAGGLGGTADVVDYARQQGKTVTVIWPKGSARK